MEKIHIDEGQRSAKAARSVVAPAVMIARA